jgi:hypothetical protein
MSSTRKAKDGAVFQQARFASSPEFERGLIANLVARRASVLDAADDRDLVWFIHYLSHQAGGLSSAVKDFVSKYAGCIPEAAMRELGEKKDPKTAAMDALLQLAGFDSANPLETLAPAEFLQRCRDNAADNIERVLCELCLDPKSSLTKGPDYFPGLIQALREYKEQYIAAKAAGAHTTALGQKVFDVLDYTAYCRGLTLMQGEARLGKSHAARAWCEQHPGLARFVEVPSGNDDVTFFRDMARGLGLGNFPNYKVVQIRERVESVLLSKDIVLVFDEAQRLWPQTNFREGYPKRIVWIMAMANAGVPIAMVSTPQFFVTQKLVERKGWNTAQLTGRISHYESLPAVLSPDDLMAVAKTILPEADEQCLRALAVYARSSARYLAAIDSISKRARYIAMRDNRATATTGDVRKAMQESVIPADTKLHSALDVGCGKARKMVSGALPNVADESILPVPISEGVRRDADARQTTANKAKAALIGIPACLVDGSDDHRRAIELMAD